MSKKLSKTIKCGNCGFQTYIEVPKKLVKDLDDPDEYFNDYAIAYGWSYDILKGNYLCHNCTKIHKLEKDIALLEIEADFLKNVSW